MERTKTCELLGILTTATMLSGCSGSSNSSPPASVATQPPVVDTRQFLDVTPASGINFAYGYDVPIAASMPQMFAGGVAAGDYNSDGRIDLFIVRGDIGANLLYRNLGGNVFEDVADQAGLSFTKSSTENYRHSGPTFADLDGDGDLDLFVGGILGDPSFVFQNNGDGTFTDATAGSGIDTLQAKNNVSAAFGDVDLDGDLDLFVSHWGTFRDLAAPGDTEHLWRNESTATVIRFVSASVQSGISASVIDPAPFESASGANYDYTFSPIFARVDDDRYPDILVAADFRTSRYFVNNLDGTFANSTDPSVVIDRNGMGAAVGDFDNDGDLDWLVTAILSDVDGNGQRLFDVGNRLYRNSGGTFEDITIDARVADGGWGWGACFADFDHDTNLDIYHTNGWEGVGPPDFAIDASRYFVSTGGGTFSEQANEAGLDDVEQGRGVVCADFDDDGDTDIFITHRNSQISATLFENILEGFTYLKVRLRGLPPNSEAAGGRIFVTAAGTTQMREITIGSNFTSQNPTEQIFGLADAQLVDELRVEWPGGTETIRTNVAVNQTLLLDQASP